ncbi:MAG: heme biosynthesis HemY N-terminal domain-containing protein [Pseudomonadota bacterium]|nr:heme biosynthesis HemY N-terminal domain-containing protein [Pseudomonadota bacterium]
MRFLIFIFLALSAGIGLTMLADNPGYVLISRQPWSIETSLIVFIPVVLAVFILFYLLLRLLDNLLSTPAKLRRWQAQRNRDQASEDTRKGITEMIIGHWPQAEKLLTRRLADSSQPEINLLGAAWIAQQNNNLEKRDDRINEAGGIATSAVDGSLTAVGLVKCQLQEQAGDIEQALTTARQLHQQTPANPAVIRSLVKLLNTAKKWQELLTTLAAAHRYHALSEQELHSLQTQAAASLLATSKDDAEVDENWKALPKKLRKQTDIIAAYCRTLADSGKLQDAEALIRNTLKREWSDELVEIYGLLKTENPSAQLKQAESWLPDHPTETPLMLCMGRLAMKSQLWGMARSYLELAVRNGDSHQATLELGWLLESLGATDTAMYTYRNGLESSLGSRAQDFTIPTQSRIEPESVNQPQVAEENFDHAPHSAPLAYSNESK